MFFGAKKSVTGRSCDTDNSANRSRATGGARACALSRASATVTCGIAARLGIFAERWARKHGHPMAARVKAHHLSWAHRVDLLARWSCNSSESCGSNSFWLCSFSAALAALAALAYTAREGVIGRRGRRQVPACLLLLPSPQRSPWGADFFLCSANTRVCRWFSVCPISDAAVKVATRSVGQGCMSGFVRNARRDTTVVGLFDDCCKAIRSVCLMTVTHQER